jgi:inosine-uridine nucleoside N-ribohydrolase
MKPTLILLCLFPLLLQGQTFILDADTGNEMDDLYAIVRAVADPQVKLLALSSAHFNNAGMATDKMWNCHNIRKKSSVRISQDLNEDLLTHLGRMDIPHPLGGLRMIGKPWGGSESSPSAASAFIRNAVKNLNPGEKLNVVSIGASSNVASAIVEEPAIASKLRCYLLGASYFSDKNTWNKSEFNIRNDLTAFDFLLNNPEVELWVMPVNVALKLKFERKASQAKLPLSNPWCKMLNERWDCVKAGDSWIMWDLALIEAIIRPELATAASYPGPPENTTRKVMVYTDIKATEMEADFWNWADKLKAK